MRGRISWRIDSGQTSIFINALTLLRLILQMLQDREYRMHIRESDAMVPFLIEKMLGQNKSTLRSKTQDVLRLFYAVCEHEDMFTYLLDSMGSSKNTRVVQECLDEIARLVRAEGPPVFGGHLKKRVGMIAGAVDHSNDKVRKAGVEVLAALYENDLGAQVWRYMPAKDRMSNMQLSLIETKLKRCKAPDGSAAAGRASRRGSGATLEGAPQGAHKRTDSTDSSGAPATARDRAGRHATLSRQRSRSRSRSRPGSARVAPRGGGDSGATGRGPSPQKPKGSPQHMGLARSATASPNTSIDADLPDVFRLKFDGLGARSPLRSSRTNSPQASKLSPSSEFSFPAPASSSSSSSLATGGAAASPPDYPRAATVAHTLAAGASRSSLATPSSLHHANLMSGSPSDVHIETPTAAAGSTAGAASSPSTSRSAAGTRRSESLNYARSSASGAGQSIPPSGGASSERITKLIHKIRSVDKATQYQALHDAWRFFDMNDCTDAELAPHFNDFVAAASAAVSRSLDGDPDQEDFRSAKWGVNALVQLFKRESLCQQLQTSVLLDLHRHLIGALVNPCVRENETAKSFLQALNMVTLKVLQIGDRTSTIWVMLKLLTAHIPEPEKHPKNGLYGDQFTSTVVRCTRKLLMVVDRDTARHLNTGFIVRGIHDFFTRHDPALRIPESQNAIKAVKAIIARLAEYCADDLRRALRDYDPNEFLVRYADAALQRLANSAHANSRRSAPSTLRYKKKQPATMSAASSAAGLAAGLAAASSNGLGSDGGSADLPARAATPPLSRESGGAAGGGGPNLASLRARMGSFKADAAGAADAPSAQRPKRSPPRPVPLTQAEIDARLKGIFERVHRKNTTKEALIELHKFTADYPQVDISPHLVSSSPVFKAYIENGLKRMRAAAEKGSAASPFRRRTPAQRSSGGGISRRKSPRKLDPRQTASLRAPINLAAAAAQAASSSGPTSRTDSPLLGMVPEDSGNPEELARPTSPKPRAGGLGGLSIEEIRKRMKSPSTRNLH